MCALHVMHAGGEHETGDAIMVMDMGQVRTFLDCSHDICPLLSLWTALLGCLKSKVRTLFAALLQGLAGAAEAGAADGPRPGGARPHVLAPLHPQPALPR